MKKQLSLTTNSGPPGVRRRRFSGGNDDGVVTTEKIIKRAKSYRPDLRLLPASPRRNFRIRRRLFRPRLISPYRCRIRDCRLQHRDMYRPLSLQMVSTLRQRGLPAL